MTVANPEPDPNAHLPHETARGQQAPGWYPDYRNPMMEVWWTGRRWHGATRPIAPPAVPGQPQIVYVQAPYQQQGQQRPQYLSGISTGQKIVHVILSICTLGLWIPFWVLHAVLSRRRIR